MISSIILIFSVVAKHTMWTWDYDTKLFLNQFADCVFVYITELVSS